MAHGTMAEDRFDEFRELHAQGLGRNAIAREMGISQVVVSRTAAHLDLAFDRSRIQAATAARLADLAERRSLLAEDLIGDAEKLRAQMWKPTLVFAFGGKDNTFESELLGEAPAADKRALMGTAGMAIDRSLKLAPPDGSSGADEAKSMLGKLFTGVAALVEQQEGAEAEGGE
ncbi:hypothetical protein ABZ341_18420 [Streptomyces sp. NPDC006173]|uniref:hypothetical protein n=1 Tax=Streptomyces sp. NPDC006173 TaxID=3155349 RepID=UPI0033CADEA7